MAFELWDAESGNLVGRYATHDEALRAVRETIALYGPDAANSLLLGVEDHERRPREIARGQSLIEQAQASPSAVTGEPLVARPRATERVEDSEAPLSPTRKASKSSVRQFSRKRK